MHIVLIPFIPTQRSKHLVHNVAWGLVFMPEQLSLMWTTLASLMHAPGQSTTVDPEFRERYVWRLTRLCAAERP